MKYLESIFSDQLIEAMGWTIFNSLWQATLLLVVLVFILLLLKQFSARIRYFIAYAFLVMTFSWSVFTGVESYNYAIEKANLKERLISSSDGISKELQNILAIEEKQELNRRSKADLKWMSFKAKVQSIFPLVFSLWLIGILFFLFRMAGALVYLQRLTKRETLPFDRKWQTKIENLCIHLSISKPIVALQSYVAKVPMIVGHLKPVVLFPVSVFTGMSDKEIEAIIAHELAHIKRNDYLFNILQSIIETLFFYHPAVWIISKIIRDEREHSCDDLAVTATGDKLNYIKALAYAQQITLTNNYKAVAFAKSNGELLTRVKRLKTMSNMKNKVTEGFFAASLIFISLILLSFTSIDKQTTNQRLEKLQSFESKKQQSEFATLNKEALIAKKDTLEKKVKRKVKKMEEVPEDLEKVIEVAFEEEDEIMAAEILKSVEEAMKEIEWAEIEKEAMLEVREEMEKLNLDSIISTSMKEAQAEMELEIEELRKIEKDIEAEALLSEEEALKAAKEAIELARVTMEAIELDTIIEFSLGEAFKALEDLNIGEIINDAMEGVEISFEEDSTAKKKNMDELEKELDELEK